MSITLQATTFSGAVKLDSPTISELATRNSPIIVGDRYELAETEAGSYSTDLCSGLVAKPAFEAALLPMSSYGQSSNAHLLDINPGDSSGIHADNISHYDTRQTPQGSMYLSSGLPSHTQPSITTYDRHIDQMACELKSVHQPCESYGGSYSPQGEYEAHQFSQTSHPPHHGTSDSYQGRKRLELRPSPKIIRKRKSTLDEFDKSMVSKRVSPSYGRSTQPESYSPPSFVDAAPAYPKDLHTIGKTSFQERQLLTPYERSQNVPNIQNDSTTMSVQGYSRSTMPPQSILQPPITQSSAYSPSYRESYQMVRSPGLNQTASLQISSPSPNARNPPLKRTSKMQQRAGPISTPGASSGDSTFNLYGVHTNHAKLEIHGNLDTMQDDWTPEERSARRRLVQFRGVQTGITINTYFKVVKPDERPSAHELRERVISCIYWEEEDEYYVTSVDTIALLEALVEQRFPVEEKNCIRRNLETHNPIAVSKNKPATENFFKVIMGFPNPKPRNIEKDVKVFRWSILAQALVKVIRKYSPDVAPMIDPLSTPRISEYSGTLSDTSSDHYSHLSSRSSTASGAYTSTTKSSALSPPAASLGASNTFLQAPISQAPTSSFTHSYTVPTMASQYSQTNGESLFEPSYREQSSLSDFPLHYANTAYAGLRSNETNPEALCSIAYSTARARANSSFLTQYEPPLEERGYSLGQPPDSVQPTRPSWDAAFLRSEPGSIGQDDSQTNLFQLPSRLSSDATQYHYDNGRPSVSQ